MLEKRQLLFVGNLRVSFGARDVLDIERLEIFDGDRIGLVGINGAGKTTLLRTLLGREDASGQVIRKCDAAYVRQAELNSQARQGEDAGLDAKLAGRLRVADSPAPSGGEDTRRALAEALSQNAPLLFLDEPTTNLDMDGIAELERQLKAREGAMVLISHDRSLLDALCGQIWELESTKIRIFPGDYTAYREQKQRERDFAQDEYEAYRQEERRLTQRVREVEERAQGMLKPRRNMSSSEWLLYKNIHRNQQKHVHNFAKSLRTRIVHLEVKERPEELPRIAMSLGAGQPITSRTALRVGPVKVGFPGKCLFPCAEFTLATGKRTVMIGPNGAGKTTLTRLALEGAEGFRLHPDAVPGYFSQDHGMLDPKKNVLENARAQSSQSEATARTVLARLGLRGDDVYKPARVLSGGERAKTALARLFLADINLLILDEPTNHLDLFAMEALQELLAAYEGTLLVITHDRALCAAVAQRVLRVENGCIHTHEGDWNSYEASLAPAPSEDQAATAIHEDIVRMRMASLAERIAQNRKGDDRAALEDEWQLLLRQLRGK